MDASSIRNWIRNKRKISKNGAGRDTNPIKTGNVDLGKIYFEGEDITELMRPSTTTAKKPNKFLDSILNHDTVAARDLFQMEYKGSVRRETLLKKEGQDEAMWIRADYNFASGDVEYFTSTDTSQSNVEDIKWKKTSETSLGSWLNLPESKTHIQKGWLQKQPIKNIEEGVGYDGASW